MWNNIFWLQVPCLHPFPEGIFPRLHKVRGLLLHFPDQDYQNSVDRRDIGLSSRLRKNVRFSAG